MSSGNTDEDAHLEKGVAPACDQSSRKLRMIAGVGACGGSAESRTRGRVGDWGGIRPTEWVALRL